MNISSFDAPDALRPLRRRSWLADLPLRYRAWRRARLAGQLWTRCERQRMTALGELRIAAARGRDVFTLRKEWSE